jgi:xanthine dehydrogenase iron-sulfur cluster and FAD-binding subunit A
MPNTHPVSSDPIPEERLRGIDWGLWHLIVRKNREECEMIPAPFAYHRPRSLQDAIGLLAEHGENVRVVAGGHSLIPMMKLRLAKPEHLLDLQNLTELRGIGSEPGTAIMDLTAQSQVPILYHKEIGDAATNRTFPSLLPQRRRGARPIGINPLA